MKIDDAARTKIEEQLIWTIIDAHRKHDFSYVQMKKSASYILKNIDKVDDHASLVRFLHNLSSHWHIFTPAFETEKEKSQN